MIKLSNQDRWELRHFRTREGELAAALQRTPTTEELAGETGFTVARILELRQMANRYHVSLDRHMQIGEDGSAALSDYLEDKTAPKPPDVALAAIRADGLGAILGKLPARHAGMLRLRYGLVDGECWEQSAIAEHYGVSRARVQQILLDALIRLRALPLPQELE